mmetsp:Transcript_6149/g.9881  ORF Transcript_6149/g.9881 Transcript_6149/m.9881 type:complete len:238 (-) Transcript_6149:2074-2787(-)
MEQLRVVERDHVSTFFVLRIRNCLLSGRHLLEGIVLHLDRDFMVVEDETKTPDENAMVDNVPQAQQAAEVVPRAHSVLNTQELVLVVDQLLALRKVRRGERPLDQVRDEACREQYFERAVLARLPRIIEGLSLEKDVEGYELDVVRLRNVEDLGAAHIDEEFTEGLDAALPASVNLLALLVDGVQQRLQHEFDLHFLLVLLACFHGLAELLLRLDFLEDVVEDHALVDRRTLRGGLD